MANRGYGYGYSQPMNPYATPVVQQQSLYTTPSSSLDQNKSRVIYGQVTKLFQNFGYVNDEIFFMKTCVKGAMVRVGDKVIVEARYQPNMPIKWNAELVQLSDGATKEIERDSRPHIPSIETTRRHFSPPKSRQQPGPRRHSPSRRRSSPRQQRRSPNRQASNSQAPQRVPPPKQSSSSRLQPTKRPHPSPAPKSANVVLSASSFQAKPAKEEKPTEKKEEVRPAPRSSSVSSSKKRHDDWLRDAKYSVSVPRYVFDIREATLPHLRKRYVDMTIPSDFFHCDLRWCDVFPMHQPIKLGYHSAFHIAPQCVHPVKKEKDDPSDADSIYSAKVMLLSSPALVDLYKRTCRMAEEPRSAYSAKQSALSLLGFLVASTGDKSKPMAIGGAWSPSLDGPNPDEDPQVLVNTAIRTCLKQTGIDLSKCKQWYRCLELHYIRSNSKTGEMNVETVVIFLPDVWSCMPSEEDWTTIKEEYANAYQLRLNPPQEEEELDESTADDAIGESTEDLTEPTSYKKLNTKIMKIADLRKQLELRTLSTKGLKANLVTRLQEALDKEAAADGAVIGDPTAVQEKQLADMTEKERAAVEKDYKLCEAPSIIVHPSPTALNGKLALHCTSLKALLQYKSSAQKDESFEVALFAEQFREMLARDSIFNIYKAVTVTQPETLPLSTDDKKDDSKRRRIDNPEEEMLKSGFVRRTVDTHLLFSCSYFDTGYAEYIQSSDLKKLFALLPLHLSEYQMKSLSEKCASKNHLFSYRNLTDVQVSEAEASKKMLLRRELDDVDYIVELASGNKVFLDEKPEKFPAITILNNQTPAIIKKKIQVVAMETQELQTQFGTLSEELSGERVNLVAVTQSERELQTTLDVAREELRRERHALNEINHVNQTSARALKKVLDLSVSIDREAKLQSSDIEKRMEKADDIIAGTLEAKEKERKKKKEEETAAAAAAAEVSNGVSKAKSESKDETVATVEEDLNKSETKNGDWKVLDSV